MTKKNLHYRGQNSGKLRFKLPARLPLVSIQSVL